MKRRYSATMLVSLQTRMLDAGAVKRLLRMHDTGGEEKYSPVTSSKVIFHLGLEGYLSRVQRRMINKVSYSSRG